MRGVGVGLNKRIYNKANYICAHLIIPQESELFYFIIKCFLCPDSYGMTSIVD